MRFSRLLTFVVVVALAGALLPVNPAEATPKCFGKRATIVGTNRDGARSVELKGTRGDDVIVGLRGIDFIDARGGDDLICGGGGDDWIEAGAGDDKVQGQDGIDDIWGGGGHDRIWGGRGPADSLFGERGNDRLFGGPGTEDYLYGGPGDDVLDGGGGEDLALFPDSPRGIEADLRAGRAVGHGRDGFVSIETVYGSAFDDVLYGDDEANTLAGGPGDDQLYGLGGNDRLRSGWGGDDLIDGGEGLDTANYFLSPQDAVHADLAAGEAVTSGVDTLVGITNLVGSKYDDTLIGNDDDNVIFGSRGNDTMDGGGGTDAAAFFDSYEMVVDLVEGTATEERFSETLMNFENVIGSTFADTIIGDDGPNAIWGDRGDDTLVGAAGDDTLIGERGSDDVNGGEGTDTCDGEAEVDCELDPTSAAAAWKSDILRSRQQTRGEPHRLSNVFSNPPAVDTVPYSDRPVGSAVGDMSTCTTARIAFVRDFPRRARSDIYSIKPNGTGLTKLTETADAWSPAWSPDGTRIAYEDWSDGDLEIYVMDPDGSNVVQLTDNEVPDASPAWSPDGEWIAFARSDDEFPDFDIFDIYKMRADGTEVTQLTTSEAQEWTPTWSPDSARIAFYSDEGNEGIVVMNADGTGATALEINHPASNPDWAPTGERIYYAGDRGDVDSEIHRINADGTGTKRLTRRSGPDQSPSVSPNGRRIAYGRDWNLAVMRTDGTRVKTIHKGPGDVYMPDWGRVPCS